MILARSTAGAIAGALGATVWAAQQPLDKRVFGCRYDDVELLGKLVTRGRAWPVVGLVLHVQNGALFGIAYAHLKTSLPGPPVARGMTAALIENFALWPLGALVDRIHPARQELPTLGRNPRALAQATWRHAIFGAAVGILEQQLSERAESESSEIPADSNGHGDIEAVLAVS